MPAHVTSRHLQGVTETGEFRDILAQEAPSPGVLPSCANNWGNLRMPARQTRHHPTLVPAGIGMTLVTLRLRKQQPTEQPGL